MVRFIVDIYHNTAHEGLKGETPANCWSRLSQIYPIDQTVDGYERRAAFGRASFNKITSRGITLFGIEYASDLVRQIFLHENVDKIECRIDPTDISWITILWKGEWHPVKAKLGFLEGVHLADWLRSEKALRVKHRAEHKVTAAEVRASLEGIRETVACAATRSNIGPSSLNPAQMAAGLKEAFMGAKITDQANSGIIKAPVPDIGLTDDDFQERDADEVGLLDAADGEDFDDDGNDAEDDNTEISK